MTQILVVNAPERRIEHPTFTEDDNFRNYLINNLGMMIFEMNMDGNCLYSALALHFHKSLDNHYTVRNNVAFAFLSNREDYVSFLTANETVASRATRIRRNGEWGGELEIAVASTFYETNIVIYQANGFTRRIPENRPYGKTVFLSYHNQNHYNLLMYTGNGNPEDHLDQIQIELKLVAENNTPRGDDCDIGSDKSFASSVKMDCDVEIESVNNLQNENNSPNICYDSEDSTGDMDTLNFQQTNNEDDCEDEMEMLELPGNAYLKNKTFGKGRHSVDIIILLPNCLKRNNLVESLKHANGRVPVFYSISYRDAILQTILDDKEITEDFTIYLSKKSIPLTISKSSIRSWYAKLMIPHVILSVARMKCFNNEMRFLFYNTNISLVPNLIFQFWKALRTILSNDADLLEANSTLFCEKCDNNCPYKDIVAHLDLSSFYEKSTNATSYTRIFEKLVPFEQNVPARLCLLEDLRETYNCPNLLSSEERKEKVYKTFDEHCQQGITYSSYLLLQVDGPNMNETSTVEEILRDPLIYKSLYAGYTKTGDYRSRHIKSNKTPVGRLHTKTSRTYLLRSKKFNKYTKCRYDESTVIEILKMTIETSRKKRQHHPFLLLNQKSETSELLALTNTTKKQIKTFCRRGIPIFTSDNNSSSNESGEGFEGNYVVGAPLNVPKEISQRKEFGDVAEQYQTIKNYTYNVSHC